MTKWGFSRTPIADARRVLDVGCGGGAAILRLARQLPEARLHGIDYSQDSLKVAARKNSRLIQRSRVSLVRGSVSQLPFQANCFDLAIAIESHYFWPDFVADLREMLRVLRPGGTAALIGGVYFGGKHDSRNRKFATIGEMNCQSLAELRGFLREEGYADVIVHEEPDKGWFCVTGRSPGGPLAPSPLSRDKPLPP
jgi:ubiquinone/menaquinone biosynthesis C-methylase UbiE